MLDATSPDIDGPFSMICLFIIQKEYASIPDALTLVKSLSVTTVSQMSEKFVPTTSPTHHISVAAMVCHLFERCANPVLDTQDL